MECYPKEFPKLQALKIKVSISHSMQIILQTNKQTKKPHTDVGKHSKEQEGI